MYHRFSRWIFTTKKSKYATITGIQKTFDDKNVDYIKANALVFYSINGRNIIDFMESLKVESVWIPRINCGAKSKEKIILVLDNSKSHNDDKTVMKARDSK